MAIKQRREASRCPIITPEGQCSRTATDLHEIVGRGAYASVKAGYEQEGNQWLICHEHHMECHMTGAKSFAIKYGLHDAYLTAINLKNAWDKQRYHSVRQIL